MCCVVDYCVVKDLRRVYGCDYGSLDDRWQVCCLVMLYVSVNVLFVIRRDTRRGLSLCVKVAVLGQWT